MKHVAFGGCSFTHSGDSWAYCARPLMFDYVIMPMYDMPNISTVNANSSHYVGPEFSLDALISQRQLHLDYHKYDDPEYDPGTFISKCKVLDIDEYQLMYAGEGAASISLTARSMISYLEKTPDVDTVVFQISGFARREVLTFNQRYLDIARDERGDNEIFEMDGLTFVKQNSDINVKMVVDGEKSKDPLRIYSAYYADYCADIEEFYIRALDQLQLLTQYCMVNNIKLGYFHGWDNLPNNWSDYCERKYSTYVKPYLLTDDNIIDYYTKKYPNKSPVDLEPSGTDIIIGHHPNCFAHREFWNDIVEPFVVF